MGKVAEAQGELFQVLLWEPILWPDGQVHVPAGSIGSAVIYWGGNTPGYMVEWAGGKAAGVRSVDELKTWCRVHRRMGWQLLLRHEMVYSAVATN